MLEEVFPQMIDLETEIVKLYDKAIAISRNPKSKQLYTKAKENSLEQIKKLKQLMALYKKPKFTKQLIDEVHDSLFNSLEIGILKDVNSPNASISISMANIETSKLYHAISDYFEKLSSFYLTISKEIESFAIEEDEDSLEI